MMPVEIRSLMIANGIEPDDVIDWVVRGSWDEPTAIDCTMKPRADRCRLELSVPVEDDS